MAKEFKTAREWIDECRALVRRDLDNVLLFTGPEGSGKSTLAFQVLKALDEGFDVSRAHFGIANFLANAPSVPRYGAVLADELEATNRTGMRGPQVDLLLFLKDCRGLNLHIGICFPHEALFEGAILDHRVRWKIHVPQRGLWVLSERVVTERRVKGETVQGHVWVERGRWRFQPNGGTLWDAYRKKKNAHMENLGGRYRELIEGASTGVDRAGAAATFAAALERGEWQDPDLAEKAAPVRAALSSGVDRGAAAAHFRSLRRKDAERAGPGAAIHDQP